MYKLHETSSPAFLEKSQKKYLAQVKIVLKGSVDVPIQISTMLQLDPYPFAYVRVDKGPTQEGWVFLGNIFVDI